MMPASRVLALATEYAADVVDPVLLTAICMVESSGDPWSVRYEPAYRWLVPDASRPRTCTRQTEDVLQRCSWGLSQIMGANARSLGWEGWLPEILKPEINLRLGGRFLAWLCSRWASRDDVIAAYNAGSPRRLPDGTYFNQVYVDRVRGALTRLPDDS